MTEYSHFLHGAQQKIKTILEEVEFSTDQLRDLAGALVFRLVAGGAR